MREVDLRYYGLHNHIGFMRQSLVNVPSSFLHLIFTDLLLTLESHPSYPVVSASGAQRLWPTVNPNRRCKDTMTITSQKPGK
jgi:hypothetical protein